MKISYSAPAKVILSGEHAVVYGKPALVSAINLRLVFTISSRSYQDGNLNKEILIISQKVKDYLKNQKIDFKDYPFNYKIDTEIPVGRGLGSSAALSVAAAASFLEFYVGRKFDKEIINGLAFEIEKHFHQNPSGVDNSAVCFGGLILYQKKIQLTNLNYKIPESFEEKLLLIDSGQPKETTAEMVNFVKKTINKKVLIDAEKIVSKLILSIKKEDERLFEKCLNDNEKLLEEIGVVSEKTKKLLEDFNKFGSGKVTGAGGRKNGSGFILFFAENKIGLEDFLKTNKIKYYEFVPDYQGLIRI